MPQASDELRGIMQKFFGDPVSDAGPIAFLQSRGYELLPNWYWRPPVPSHTVNEAERLCLCFLIDEWDFGGLEPGGA